MNTLKTFITPDLRPPVRGARLKEESLKASSRASTKLGIINPALCIGPANDFVLKHLAAQLTPNDPIVFLSLDNILNQWNYSLVNGELRISIASQIITPRSVYLRGAMVESDDARFTAIGEFFDIISAWRGKLLCRPCDQQANESKLYQSQFSLRKAIDKFNLSHVKLPPTYLLKTKQNEAQTWSEFLPKSAIVKSLSGIRSQVVDQSQFYALNPSGPSDLPSLFQEKILGRNIRIHCFNGEFWPVEILGGENTADYRYASGGWTMREHPMPQELKDFCLEVQEIERCPLMGMDFILDSNGVYWCLEANPGPGWAWYEKNTSFEVPLSRRILQYLMDVK